MVTCLRIIFTLMSVKCRCHVFYALYAAKAVDAMHYGMQSCLPFFISVYSFMHFMVMIDVEAGF